MTRGAVCVKALVRRKDIGLVDIDSTILTGSHATAIISARIGKLR
ncbi:hypothetical protein RHECNPAF_12600124 [Rhizobium etli CNPAF512]|nr:hypothetical protein RHECNPAF_12600124 [Rhizobium etli CNPAF512]